MNWYFDQDGRFSVLVVLEHQSDYRLAIHFSMIDGEDG